MTRLEHHSTAEHNRAKNLQGSNSRRAILAASSNDERALVSARLTATDVEHAIKVATVDATTAKIIQDQPINSTVEADISPCKMLYENLHHDHGNDKLGPAKPHQQGLVYCSLFSRRRHAPRILTSRLPLPVALPQMHPIHHQGPPNLASGLGEGLEMKLQFPSLQDH